MTFHFPCHAKEPYFSCLNATEEKRVRFAPKDKRKAYFDIKNPTFVKWGLKNRSFTPFRTDSEGKVEMKSQAEIEFYENWSRNQALKLYKELHPESKVTAKSFFRKFQVQMRKFQIQNLKNAVKLLQKHRGT
jgi:hypothetical protein